MEKLLNKITCCDCLELLGELPDDSIDCMVTDPPYFLINNQGAGFMGKQWDGINDLWRYIWTDNMFVNFATRLLLEMTVEPNTAEGDFAHPNANGVIIHKKEEQEESVQFVNENLKFINLLKKDFAHLLVLTKQEVWDLFNESLPNHIKIRGALNSIKSNAKFVIPLSLLKRKLKNIAVGNVLKPPIRKACEEKTTQLTLTDAVRIKEVIEAKIGNGCDFKSIKEINSFANYAESIAIERKYNATTLSPIKKHKIMKVLTLLLYAMYVTPKQNIANLLIANFYQTVWKQCLRVLKPGAFAFIMCIPRQDCLGRMIVALEDAGFKTGFTSIYWAYACLSEDTEVYTKEGWKQIKYLYKVNTTDILIYDGKTKECHFESPSAWYSYRIAENMYRIKSEETDQLVSRNHRVYTKQGFKLAENLKEQTEMVYLSELPTNICDISSRDKKETSNSRNVLYNQLQAKSSDLQACNRQRKTYSFNVRKAKAKAKQRNDGRKKQSLEGRNYLQKAKRQLYESINQICEMSKRLFRNGAQRRLCYGASVIDGAKIKQTIKKTRTSSSYKSQCRGQQNRKSNVIQNKSRPQEIRIGTERKTTLATVLKEYYEGIIACPAVSTGCFVARRKNKIFLTGNSGFPKAGNIGKMVDKQLGAEREITANNPNYRPISGKVGYQGESNFRQTDGMATKKDKPATDQAKALDGSYAGFQPKPAVEVILVAMKPLSEKTYVDQAMSNGKGITWLDKCRVPYRIDSKGNPITPQIEHSLPRGKRIYSKEGAGSTEGNATKIPCYSEKDFTSNPQGRFPANLLVSKDVLNDGKIRKGSGAKIRHNNDMSAMPMDMNKRKPRPDFSAINDSGSFSCYFSLDAWWNERLKKLPESVQKTFPFLIVPKPSKREKNRGCEGIEFKIQRTMGDYAEGGSNRNSNRPKLNHHPTCKPIKLMSYLITLGSRAGDIILDPFAGSGTTAIAAKMLNRKFIACDSNEEYYEIARARLKAVQDEMESDLLAAAN